MATAAASNAVGLIGSEVTDRASRPLSEADVRRQLAVAGASTRSPTTPATQPTSAAPSRSRPPTAPPTRPGATRSSPPSPSAGVGRPVTRTFSLRGGTAAVTCTGDRAVLDYASPNPGYEVYEGRSGDEVQVRFRSDDRESRLRVACAAGVPRGEIREED